jgi:hypothetical protein
MKREVAAMAGYSKQGVRRGVTPKQKKRTTAWIEVCMCRPRLRTVYNMCMQGRQKYTRIKSDNVLEAKSPTHTPELHYTSDLTLDGEPSQKSQTPFLSHAFSWPLTNQPNSTESTGASRASLRVVWSLSAVACGVFAASPRSRWHAVV